MATLRNTYTAVIARGERWTGQVYTEPYEAAWASEAVFFIHLMPDSTPPSGTAVARVQSWLRLAVAVPNSCVFKVVATLSLKA
ncbi:MAG: hypothetical protein NT071_00990 [Burkholderiales bacterium]|nr:hypothetical protein [Burkholderiales bacterium]